MCSVSFNDKPYQEINFESHLSSVLLCKQKKILSDLHMSRAILFHFTWSYSHFCNEIEKLQL